MAVLPLAVTTTLLLYGGPSTELIARLPISVIVWLTSAQLLARYRARNRGVVDDLETQAHRDPLTGLGNRNGLERRLAAMRPGDAALLVDLDHFKRINDNAGHSAGDQVLRDFGAVVRTVLRGRDYAIRYGGEEILILLPGSGAAGAQRLDTRLRAAWAQAQPAVTYSAGIAIVGEGLATGRGSRGRGDVHGEGPRPQPHGRARRHAVSYVGALRAGRGCVRHVFGLDRSRRPSTHRLQPVL